MAKVRFAWYCVTDGMKQSEKLPLAAWVPLTKRVASERLQPRMLVLRSERIPVVSVLARILTRDPAGSGTRALFTVTEELLSVETKDKNDPFIMLPVRMVSRSTCDSVAFRVSSISYTVIVFCAPSPRAMVRVTL